MTPLHAAVEIAALTAAVLALRPPRAPTARSLPVAAVLFATAGLDVAREVAAALVFRPERAHLLAEVAGDEMLRPPFASVVRALYHAEQAGYLAGPSALVVGLAAVACAPPRWRRAFGLVTAGAWATTSAILVVAYPTVSGLAWAPYDLQPVYRAWHALCALTAALLWATGVHRLPRPRRLSSALRTVAILATAELLVAFAGPYAWAGPRGSWAAGERWDLARVIYLCAFAAAAVVFLRRDDLDHGGGSNTRRE